MTEQLKTTTAQGGDEVASPCINLCKIDQISGFCGGCFRTIEEITVWSKASNAIKQEIWKKIVVRTNDTFD